MGSFEDFPHKPSTFVPTRLRAMMFFSQVYSINYNCWHRMTLWPTFSMNRKQATRLSVIPVLQVNLRGVGTCYLKGFMD
jgi:hypothetical protein